MKNIDYLEAISGKDIITGATKCSLSIGIEKADSEGNYVPEEPLTMINPIVEAKRRGQYTEISFIFPSCLDPMFQQMLQLLDRYAKEFDQDAKEYKKYPTALLLSLVPMEYCGAIVVIAKMPIIWNSGAETGKDYINTIKILFDAENICCVYDDEFDYEQARESEIAKQKDIDFYNNAAEKEREKSIKEEDMIRRSRRI